MKKLERSPYNADMVLGFVLDEEKGALATTMDAEFAVELSHEDGDSVLAVLPTLELSESQEKACIGIKSVVLYVEKGSAQVLVSPKEEGELFFPLCELAAPGMSEVKQICAKRIKLVLGEDSLAHICGQG